MKKILTGLGALLVIGALTAFFLFRIPLEEAQVALVNKGDHWVLVKGPGAVWSTGGSNVETLPLEESQVRFEIGTKTRDLDEVTLEVTLDLGGVAAGESLPLESRGEAKSWQDMISADLGRAFTDIEFRQVLLPESGGPLGAVKTLTDSNIVPLVTDIVIVSPTEAFQAKALARPLQPMVQQKPPLVVIGWDGGDWQTLDPMLEAGQMPNLQALLQRGVRAPMRSRQPMLSPLLWTSMATGLSPDEHGIMDFLVKDPKSGNVLPITSRSRKAPAIWNMVEAAGKKPAVFAWWATYPAEPIEGVIVTDRAYYSLFNLDPETLLGPGLTHPPGFMSGLGFTPMQAEDLGVAYLRPFIPDITEEDVAAAKASIASGELTHEAHLMKILAKTINYHRIAMSTWETAGPFDFFTPYYEAVDEIGHRFMHFMPPQHKLVSEEEMRRYQNVVPEMYRLMDVFLGDWVRVLPTDSHIFVISDHGFKNGTNRPANDTPFVEGKPGLWHRTFGMAVLAGPMAKQNAEADTVRLEEICPTMLALMGMPMGDDMESKPANHLFASPYDNKDWATIPSYRDYVYPVWKMAKGDDSGGSSEEDKALLEDLIALGYVSADAVSLDDSGNVPQEGGESVLATDTAAGSDSAGDPTDNMWLNRAGALREKGDLAGAEQAFLDGIKAQPDYLPLHNAYAGLLIEQQKNHEAYNHAKDLLPKLQPPQRGDMLAVIAEAGTRLEKTAEAAELVKEYGRGVPESQASVLALGILLEAQNRPGDAAATYIEFLKREPESTRILGRLVLMYQGQDRAAELVPVLDELLVHLPEEPTILAFSGIARVSLGRFQEAVGFFDRALAQNPDHVVALINLGVCYSKMGQEQKAVPILQKALRKNDASVEGWLELGVSLARMQQFAESEKAFRQALRLVPDSGPATMGLAINLVQTGRVEEAKTLLRQALEKNPDQPRLQSLLQDIS